MKTKRKSDPRITETYRGYSGPGWEFSVTGRASFVKRMVKKYVPEIQRIAAGQVRKPGAGLISAP